VLLGIMFGVAAASLLISSRSVHPTRAIDGTAGQARRRGPGRRWPPGVSGNPRGRLPALPSDLVALKAAHGPEFLGQLISLTRSEDEKIRVGGTSAENQSRTDQPT
jgi:hypothetical protein